MGDRILLRGGHVLTMDERLGEHAAGDVLIDGPNIAEVAPRIEVGDAEIVDVAGHVVMPGFVDTHRHTWQTPYRGMCAGLDARGLLPRDSHVDLPQLLGRGRLRGQLRRGARSPRRRRHDDPRLLTLQQHPRARRWCPAGLRDAGIRAMFAYGYYPAPSATPVFTEHRHRLDDARRIREQDLSSEDSLVTMGIALTEVGLLPFDQTIAEARSARELGVPSVLHTGCNWGSLVTEGVAELDHHGLLGADQVHVHCNTLDDRDFRRLVDNDCKVSSSPETEIQMGMGHPVIRRALQFGMRPSLSCDVVSSNSGDMFSQMRLGLQFERCMRNDAFNARSQMPEPLDLTVRDALRWGTANGAHAMGLEHRIGSLTPGKRADVIVIGGRRLNMVPMAIPSAAWWRRPTRPTSSTCSSQGASSSATVGSSASISTTRSSSRRRPRRECSAPSPPVAGRCLPRCQRALPTSSTGQRPRTSRAPGRSRRRDSELSRSPATPLWGARSDAARCRPGRSSHASSMASGRCAPCSTLKHEAGATRRSGPTRPDGARRAGAPTPCRAMSAHPRRHAGPAHRCRASTAARALPG